MKKEQLPEGYFSPNFTIAEVTRSETAIELGIDNSIKSMQVHCAMKFTCEQQEIARAILGCKIIVINGHRCEELNEHIPGASSTSQHCLGEALDFIAPDFGTPAQVYARLMESGIIFDQMISYENRDSPHVHISYTEVKRMRKMHWIVA